MRLLLGAEQLRRSAPDGISTYIRGLARGLAALAPPPAGDGAQVPAPAPVEGQEAGGPTGAPIPPGGDRQWRPEVTLWASRHRGARAAADPLAALGVPVVTSPLPGRVLVWAWDRGWSSRWTSPPPGFDLVHAPSLAVPPAGPAPLAVTVHDLAWRRVPETFPARGRRWHEAALGRALARADLLVTPSRQTADDLVAAGAAAGRVEVIAEGCDHLPPPDAEAASAALARLGVEGPYLLTVSTLEPRKNLPRLIAAYQAARPRLPEPWPLLVVGPAGWGEALQPQPGVVLAGPVQGAVLAGLYAGARLVVSVPLVEGFGLPALEAMVFGVPVVASPLPSTGEAAYQVDPTDVQALSDALVRVAGDDQLRDDLISAGRARAAQLTWAAAAAGHVAAWSSLLTAAAGRSRG